MTGEMIYMMVDIDIWDIDVCMGDEYMLGESYTKDNITDRTSVYLHVGVDGYIFHHHHKGCIIKPSTWKMDSSSWDMIARMEKMK